MKSVQKLICLSLLLGSSHLLNGQHSVARQWNEVLLEAIRNDFARPTVHARNLFHISAAMYDAWAVFDEDARPYLLGNTVHGFTSNFDDFQFIGSMEDNRNKAISHAAFRLLEHRFGNSPKFEETEILINDLLNDLGIDPSFTSVDYSSGSSAALGNYIAQQYIEYGLQDGSNEESSYVNQHYQPVNEPLFPEEDAGNPTITDPNRWQPLEFSTFIDQSGEILESAVPAFLSPEWGQVLPFSLKSTDATTYTRDNFDYIIYHDPGPPPYHDPENDPIGTAHYQWNFSLVAIWSGHLDANLEATIDISPGAKGNFDFDDLPTNVSEYDLFYNYEGGGDISEGRPLNPFTNQPYEPQVVRLGDYGRILAEFWADGPDSETPPGHWFTILNYVNDELEEKRFNGQGEIVDDLEWDVKSYFLLGGTMHDVAISAWGIKGYYDYIRPISAIRYLADLGQSTDDQLPNYNAGGIPLVDGYIELVTSDDPVELKGEAGEHMDKIKLFAWRGPGTVEDPNIPDPETDVAGVGWILAENWWPYQRPSFITPPFAGYVSGHSTYSRAAAELLTLITGSPFFPNGMGEFDAPMNEFLVFEDGPSEDITLQWATYQDASDQCSLSRIWGGIHPPADDIPGRIIGEQIGKDAFAFALNYFNGTVLSSREPSYTGLVYPNPTQGNISVLLPPSNEAYEIRLIDMTGRILLSKKFETNEIEMDISKVKPGQFVLMVQGEKWRSSHFIIKE